MPQRFAFLIFGLILLGSCTISPPSNPDDICSIFRERPQWYDAALDVEKTWGAPIQVPMAIMYQESSFQDDALPPRDYLLGFIPWGRISSAYGYSQALDDTWDQYKRETGKIFVRRDDFADALDFIGWYMHKSQRQNGISKADAYNQYLNYHEGWTGFERKSYKRKAWLPRTARKVEARARRYASQYKDCAQALSRSGGARSPLEGFLA